VGLWLKNYSKMRITALDMNRNNNGAFSGYQYKSCIHRKDAESAEIDDFPFAVDLS